MTIRRLTLLAAALLMVGMTAAVAQYAGPKLEGTATLRNGDTLSGVILLARLGLVDGAEIGAQLRDGGYIKMSVDGAERDVKATDIAAIEAEWDDTGTSEMSKWKITRLAITTRAGETIVGEPGWMLHATALTIEQEDGTRKTVTAYPVSLDDFSPENLLASLVLGETTPGTDVGVITPAPDTPDTTPTTPEPGTTTPTTGTVVIEPEPGTTTPTTTPTTPTTTTPDTTPTTEPPTITVTAPPVISGVEESAVFATGEPAVIVFEVTNPETGRPMRIKFLLVPLPAE